MKTPVIYWKLFVLLVSLGKVYSQTTNNFPLVNVNDSSAGIDVGTQKTYTTRVRLIATTPSSTFVPSVFQNDAVNFYQQTLGGSYAAVTGVVGTSGTSSTGQLIVDVVYNVLYSFTAMQNVGITDNQVTTEIGTYQAVIDGINDFGTTLKNFYVFETDSSVFVFSGSSICSAPGTNCTANTVCNETLSGVTVMCISACKKGYCQNNGTCEQASSATGPTCTCLSTADVWFLGTTCQTRVELWMVIVAAVLGFLLILAAIILACCCYVTKRRKKEKESGLYLTSEKTTTYTNKGYLDTEHGQITKVDAVPRYQERSVDAFISRRRRSRSRSPSRDRYRRRERRRSEDSRERRHRHRHRSDDDESRRHPRRTRSNTTASSYNSFDSSDSSERDIEITNAIPVSAPAPQVASSSSGSVSSASESLKDTGTSPIRWLDTNRSPVKDESGKLGKIDIAARKGWVPSLGAQMFNLAGSREHLDRQDTLPSGEPLPYYGETDI